MTKLHGLPFAPSSRYRLDGRMPCRRVLRVRLRRCRESTLTMEPHHFTRRGWFKGAGSATLGLLLDSGCARRSPSSRFESVEETSRRFARVRVSPDRVIRTVAGLRPYRPSGFVVRAERLASKLLVHNYGHGGGGVTLSWGTAELAVEQAREVEHRVAAVLGCGAVGLATARLLQRQGWNVTIYARDLPPETTSNIAGAQWSPFSVYSRAHATDQFEAQFRRAARASHRAFQDLVHVDYGVRWIENYVLSSEPRGLGSFTQGLGDLYPGARHLAPGEHPFDAAHVLRVVTMLVEPAVYLNALLRDFLIAGGRLNIRELVSSSQVLALEEPVIFNCTGLGAKQLFEDDEMVPVKGQLVVLVPQPEVDYVVLAEDFLYMMPRRDGILLGGSFEHDVWDLEPDPRQTERILAGHALLFHGRQARGEDP